ncbi:T9SS type A sorting domain-containing protein [bacterium]|nr:T9SS type A sorting domain-containing protein [bacterium]MBU1984106.1 T9SS type A sorting domain-containing protein [bacterium]
MYYLLNTFNHSRYEDGGLSYSILEERFLGTDYWIPVPNQVVSILAIRDNTTVTVGSSSCVLQAGETAQRPNVAVGTHVTSSAPIMVVAANYEADHYGATYALEVPPVTGLGCAYFSPHSHAHGYQDATDMSRICILATEDGTMVSVGGSPISLDAGQFAEFSDTAGIDVQSNHPIYAVYINDVHARDPWAGEYRHYQYAFPLVSASDSLFQGVIEPSNTAGDVEICVVSLRAGNVITFSTEGVVRRTDTLSLGQRLYIHIGDIPGWADHSLSILARQPGVQMTRSVRCGWAGVSETTWGTSLWGKAIPRVLNTSPFRTVLPEHCTLRQNYPNPFNTSTMISYDLSRSGYVSLRVSDLLGREVAVLEEGFVEAGTHQVIFGGNGLASGIYFVQLNVGTSSQTKKLMLLK